MLLTCLHQALFCNDKTRSLSCSAGRSRSRVGLGALPIASVDAMANASPIYLESLWSAPRSVKVLAEGVELVLDHGCTVCWVLPSVVMQCESEGESCDKRKSGLRGEGRLCCAVWVASGSRYKGYAPCVQAAKSRKAKGLLQQGWPTVTCPFAPVGA